MDDLQVVDVNADADGLAVGQLLGEDAGVGVVELDEAHLVLDPGEEDTLQAAASLLDAVDWLLDASDERLAVGAELDVPGSLVAVHALALQELALEVGRDEVDAPHTAAVACRVGEEAAGRRVAQRC